jgi:hypothetical protein
MKVGLLSIAVVLSLLAYFFVNFVMCSICLFPGCGTASIAISFIVLVVTWAFLLFTDSGLQ